MNNKLVIFQGFEHVLLEVLVALTPLLLFFFFFQVFFLKFEWTYVKKLLVGIVMTFIGLALFLQGVYIGFFPVGTALGENLGSLPNKWILIPIGFVLGLVATLAEPAVRILCSQVEEVSSGYVKDKIMLMTLALGVAAFTALAMAKIIYGIPLQYIIIPGYILALIMLKFSDTAFIAIAFDSGAVATGPMTVTFIMAVAIGVATVMEERDAVIDGFGLVALVALAPILSVMALGLLYREKEEDQ